MRFTLSQNFSGSPAAVVAAYSSPGLYDTFEDLDNIGRPEVLGHRVTDDGLVHLEVRYRYTGDLPPGASAFINTSTIAVVESSVIDLSNRSSMFEMRTALGRQFRGTGRTAVEVGPDGETAVRTISGDLRIGIPLVGAKVERAIIEGLAESLAAQVPLVEAWAL